MRYDVRCESTFGQCSYDGKIHFKAEKKSENAFFYAEFLFPDWEEDAFVFMPAGAYNGNRFKKSKQKYPPRYQPHEYGENNEPLISAAVPSMGVDGKQLLELTSADMAVPCFGLYHKTKKEGIFIMTPQQVKGRNIGYSVMEGRFLLSYPANRSHPYYATKYDDYTTVDEKGIVVCAGEHIESELYVHPFSCDSFETFYREFFTIRKRMLKSTRVSNMYTDALWRISEDMNNRERWSGYRYPASQVWHAGGWCDGSGIESAALLRRGNALSKERAQMALEYDFLPDKFTPAGFIYTTIKDGAKDGSFHLTRFSAASLYYLMKCLCLCEMKPHLLQAAQTLSDAFVRLFDRYGKFGSYINSETGEMLIGSGASGILAIGGLAKSGAYFGKREYLDIAVAAAEYYRKDFLQNGMTCGGPGDILSAPDSESAFMALEAYVSLYEVIKDKQWLDFSETLAQYCSSWVVSYVHKFPDGSEFDRLGINTVGSVIASVQNTHSAPGICTLSGDCLYKLYQYTGNEEYLELVKDIAYFIPQCVSTEERPIHAYMGYSGEALKPGWINERVNMSDWERKYNGQGNVFYCNCWCSNAFLLSFAELMDLVEFKADIL